MIGSFMDFNRSVCKPLKAVILITILIYFVDVMPLYAVSIRPESEGSCFTEDTSLSFLPAHDEKEIFTPENIRAIWEEEMVSDEVKIDCAIRWYAPNGRRVVGDNKRRYASLRSTLDISGYASKAKDGLWAVACFKSAEVVDSVYFLIGDHDPADVTTEDLGRLFKRIGGRKYVPTDEKKQTFGEAHKKRRDHQKQRAERSMKKKARRESDGKSSRSKRKWHLSAVK